MTRPATPCGPSPSGGLYANYFEVGCTAFEVVLDFGQNYSEDPSPCHTRIVTSPIYARALLVTLEKSLDEYEARFGSSGDATDGPAAGDGGSER